jgi:hypothetical protein
MVIGLALGLIIVVVLGVAGLVSMDVLGRPFREWYGAIKGWQQLIGAVLGFTGAAGVFVLGTALQAEQDYQQQLRTQYSIGRGLALEVERMAQALNAGRMMASTAVLDGSTEGARQCRLFMGEMRRYMAPDAPVYKAVLGNLANFGNANLTWFVRFHGVYEEILRAVGPTSTETCTEAGASADVGYIASLIEGALANYEEIAASYDIVSIREVDRILNSQPAAEPAAEPAKPDQPETATANAAN